MIHFHCYQQEPLKYEAGFDPASGALSVTGAITAKITLAIADIRARYGADDLLVYVDSDDAGNLSTGVFPGEAKGVSEARKTFLRQLWTSGRLLLMADLPAACGSWTDPGVRVVSIYSFTDTMEKNHAIEVTTNEPGLKSDDFARYLQDNPLRIAWAIEVGTVIDAKAV